MKKLFTLAATALLAGALLIGGCGSQDTANAAKTIKVGATPVPHAEILKQVQPLLKKDGYDLQIVEFNDYVQPNTALAEKEIDANFFQHVPYLDKFNSEHKTDLVSVGKVHVEPMGVYSHKIKDLKNVSNGAKVAISNDPSNAGRALLLLQNAGLITLKNGGTITSTLLDIENNPKNLDFVQLDAAQIPRSIDDVEVAVINTNYALQAGLNPLKDSLYLESKDSPYANVLVVRKGSENDPKIKALVKALNSPEVKKFIEDNYKGAIVPAF